MNTSITARHFNASQQLQEYAAKNAEKLNRFYDGLMDCDIIFEPSGSPENPQKAEINLKAGKLMLNASEKADTYEKALAIAIDNIRRQLIKSKGKLYQSRY